MVRQPRTLGRTPGRPMPRCRIGTRRRRLSRTNRGALHDAGAVTDPDRGQQGTADTALRQGTRAQRWDASRDVWRRLRRRPAGHTSRVRHLDATTTATLTSTLHALRSIKLAAGPDVPHVTPRRDVSVTAVLTGGPLRTGQHNETLRRGLRAAYHRRRQKLLVLLGHTPQIRRARRHRSVALLDDCLRRATTRSDDKPRQHYSERTCIITRAHRRRTRARSINSSG